MTNGIIHPCSSFICNKKNIWCEASKGCVVLEFGVVKLGTLCVVCNDDNRLGRMWT